MSDRISTASWVAVALPYVLLVALSVVLSRQIRRKRVTPTPESLEATRVLMDRQWLTSGWVALGFTLVYLGVSVVLRLMAMTPLAKGILVCVPVAAFAWFVAAFVREMRSVDELARQVQRDACAAAFMMFLVWSIGMWVGDQFITTVRHGNFDAGLGFLPLFYFFGMFLAKARYIPTPRSTDESP